MSEVTTKKDLEALKAEVEDLRAGAEKFKALNALTTPEHAHYAKLSQADRDAFLDMTPYTREAAIKKASEMTDVVYTASDGAEYTKSDDPRLVQMAKDRDADRKKTAALEATIADRDLRKRAEAFPHLYGSTEDAMAALKAFDTIKDEAVRENCYKMLQSQDAGLATSFKDASEVTGVKVGETAESDIRKQAEEQAEKTGVSVSDAMAALLKTAEGHQMINTYNDMGVN